MHRWGCTPPLFPFHRHHLHVVESRCRNKEVRIPKRVHPVCEVLLVCYPPVNEHSNGKSTI